MSLSPDLQTDHAILWQLLVDSSSLKGCLNFWTEASSAAKRRASSDGQWAADQPL